MQAWVGEPSQGERPPGVKVARTGGRGEVRIAAQGGARRHAQVAKLKFELYLRGAQQLPISVAKPRFELVVGLPSEEQPRI
jgi:hypothetical protein